MKFLIATCLLCLCFGTLHAQMRVEEYKPVTSVVEKITNAVPSQHVSNAPTRRVNEKSIHENLSYLRIEDQDSIKSEITLVPQSSSKIPVDQNYKKEVQPNSDMDKWLKKWFIN